MKAAPNASHGLGGKQEERNLTFNQPLALSHYMDKPGINSEVQESMKQVSG